MSLRERAAQLREARADEAGDSPASTPEKAKPKPKNAPASTKAKAEPKAETAKPTPKVTGSKPVKPEDFADIEPDATTHGEVEVEAEFSDEEMTQVREAVSGLSKSEIEELLAAIEAADEVPLVASLKATRLTKTGGVQYDGKTPEGYVIRVWAPEDADMVTHASLEIP